MLRAERLADVADASVDLVFSHYALHWVLDKSTMLDEVQRVLRPGGRFVAECLGKPIEFLEHLFALMPLGQQSLQRNDYRSDAQWRAMLETRPFNIIDFSWSAITLRFADIAALFSWLEGTSHGDFRRDLLPVNRLQHIGRQYPDVVNIGGSALRMMLRRMPAPEAT